MGDKKVILGAAALTLLVVGGSAVFLWYDWRKIKEGEAQIERTRQEVAVAREKKRKVPDLERDVIILRENLEEYVKVLPDESEVNDFVNKLNKFQDQSGVVILNLDDVKTRTRADSKDPFEKVVYKLKLRGTAQQFLTFANLLENYERFVRIASFDVASGTDKGGPGDKEGEPRHAINLTIETFVYNPGPVTKGQEKVEIREFKTKREALKEEIVRARSDLKILRYLLRKDLERRDPFLDPRRRAGGGPDADALAQQKKFVTWAKEEVRLLRQLLDQEAQEPNLIKKVELKREIDDRIKELDGKLVLAQKEKWITVAALAEDLRSKVREELEGIKRRRNLSGGDAGLSEKELTVILSRMKEAFDRGELTRVVAQHSAVEKKLALSPVSPRARELTGEINDLKRQALVIQEFGKRKIEIRGIVFQPVGSVAIINNRVLEKGESLDDEVSVHDIREDEIEFLFRNVRVVRRTD